MASAFRNALSFGAGFGIVNVIGIFMVILGLFMVNKAKKKNENSLIGIILMVIGVALSFGFGADQLMNQFN